MLKKAAVIFDFDGTITNGESLPKDWTLNEGVNRVFADTDKVLIVTHRHEEDEDAIVSFLNKNTIYPHGIFMREKDNEDAVTTKRNYARELKEKYVIMAVFDDDEECCEMYKEEIGCTVFHVI